MSNSWESKLSLLAKARKKSSGSMILLASMLTTPVMSNENAVGLGRLACQSAIALADRADYRERLGQWAVGYLSGLNAKQPAGKRRNIDQVAPQDAGQQTITACRFVEPSAAIASVVRQMYEALPAAR